MASRLSAGKLRAVRAVPASDVAAAEAALHGVPLTTLEVGGGVGPFECTHNTCTHAGGAHAWTPVWQLRVVDPGQQTTWRGCPPPCWLPLQEAGGRLDFFFEAADELSNDAEGSLAFMIGCAQQPTQVHGII